MHRYIFQPYKNKSKGVCPSCKQPNSFVYYVDTETSTLLPFEYGRCDREEKCGYHFSPYENPPKKSLGEKVIIPTKKDYYNTLNKSYLNKSLEEQFKDVFSLYLISLFGKKAIEVLSLYKVGFSSFFGGRSTVFWQISKSGEIRSGKIFKYEDNGKRKKTPYPCITWVHSFLEEDFQLKQCFFGEHLIVEDKKIAVVESEKTALIMACVKPQYVWIASTQLHGLSDDKLQVLKDCKTTFFPDKGAFKIWQEKIKDNNNWKISNFLEKTSLDDGTDIADYILLEKNLQSKK